MKIDNKITHVSFEDRGVGIPVLQDLDLQYVETRPDILVLEVFVQGEKNHRYYKVGKDQFLDWMKDKIHQLDSD